MTGQGNQIPVHRVERDCVLNGCAGILQDIDQGLATLQDPRARKLLGDTVVQGLIERQLMDLSRVYDHHAAQGYTVMAEDVVRVAKNTIGVLAIHPGLKFAQYTVLGITGTEAADKVSSGDVAGGFVQGGAFVAGEIAGNKIAGSVRSTGVYSKEFLDWIKSLYGAAVEKSITGVYDVNKNSHE
jgi:hypothetical protein